MKKLKLTLILLSFLPLWMNAQEEKEILPVNWEEIKKEVKTNPKHVKELVARMSVEQQDTTLTYPEKILAFYGQSLLTKDKEEAQVAKMEKLAREGKLKQCLKKAKKILEINPLNLDALTMTGQVLFSMAQDSVRWPQVKADDARCYVRCTAALLNTIDRTGDGSKEHPFYVSKISDEYNFIRFYLNLWKLETQMFAGEYDIFSLGETSQFYNRSEIYFDITRVNDLMYTRLQREKMFRFH